MLFFSIPYIEREIVYFRENISLFDLFSVLFEQQFNSIFPLHQILQRATQIPLQILYF